MKYFFLSLDLEEWYHLEYFQKYNPEIKPLMINNLSSFFDLLDKYNIKITVFVLGEVIDSHIDLIKEIKSRGHEIAIHGWDHYLLNGKNTIDFINEIKRTKEYLESIIKNSVIGYRAPCFSLNNDKLEALMKIGIKYDSSFIQFKEHPLYGSLNMDDFSKKEDIIYKKGDFYEFELPTLKIFTKAIPISGGGYFRLFPKLLFSILWERYLKTNQNFTMYIHPFELTSMKVDLNGFGFLNKIRFSVGRKKNLEKLEWLIQRSIKANFKFTTMSDYVNNNKL
jgi:polysaccharide deacetylase family protein (PEP-CTERM system associated)